MSTSKNISRHTANVLLHFACSFTETLETNRVLVGLKPIILLFSLLSPTNPPDAPDASCKSYCFSIVILSTTTLGNY